MLNFLAKGLIVLMLLSFHEAGANADEEIDDIRTPLGVLQDPPVMFCVVMQDTIELATFEGDNRPLWAKKVKEGKCGQVNLPYFYSKVAAVAYIGQYPLYIMEVKLRLKNTNASLPLKHIYLKVYQYISRKPHGAIWATWKPDYGASPKAVQDWFRNAKPTPAASLRLKINTCCNQAERLRTKFVNLAGQQWMYYPDPTCVVKGCKILPIPDDVVHEEEIHASNSDDDKLPEFEEMRLEGVLFIYQGQPSCFWPPHEGGI